MTRGKGTPLGTLKHFTLRSMFFILLRLQHSNGLEGFCTTLSVSQKIAPSFSVLTFNSTY